MKTTKSLRIKTKVRAGGASLNHSSTKGRLKVRTKIRAGETVENHNATRVTPA